MAHVIFDFWQYIWPDLLWHLLLSLVLPLASFEDSAFCDPLPLDCWFCLGEDILRDLADWLYRAIFYLDDVMFYLNDVGNFALSVNVFTI